MFADLIRVNDPRWVRALEGVPHDVYHLPQYSRFAARHEGGVPVAFYAERDERRMLVPLLLRPIPDEFGAPEGSRDVTSPYGYPAPVTSHPDDNEWLEECRVALFELARTHQIVTAFVRLHPLRGVPAGRLATYGTVIEHGQVVCVDLTKPPSELFSDMRRNHRKDIERLGRHGFTLAIDDWSVYPAFASMYRATMERVAADRFYHFSDRYFEDLLVILGDHLHLCAVFSPGGEMAAAGLFLHADGIIQYHLGGTAPAYLKHAPSKLIFESVGTWASAIGATVMHLGGGTGGRADSLFHFKAGFGGERAVFHTVRIVFDEAVYGGLASVWRVMHGNEGGSDYFPIYRTPSCGTAEEVTKRVSAHP